MLTTLTFSVATALPRISSDLHSGDESAWVATAYLLTRYDFFPRMSFTTN